MGRPELEREHCGGRTAKVVAATGQSTVDISCNTTNNPTPTPLRVMTQVVFWDWSNAVCCFSRCDSSHHAVALAQWGSCGRLAPRHLIGLPMTKEMSAQEAPSTLAQSAVAGGGDTQTWPPRASSLPSAQSSLWPRPFCVWPLAPPGDAPPQRDASAQRAAAFRWLEPRPAPGSAAGRRWRQSVVRKRGPGLAPRTLAALEWG